MSINASDAPLFPALNESADQMDHCDWLTPLLRTNASTTDESRAAARQDGVLVGELLALVEDGKTPLVTYAGRVGSAAVRARTVIDLRAPHIGSAVVLMFEDGDVRRPIVMGVLREAMGWPQENPPATVGVDANGERMIVEARDELVFRCGKASITLAKSGRVVIDGTYILSRSTGVNRVRGGSIQLN